MALRQSRLFVLLLCCLCWSFAAHAETVQSIGPPTNYVTDLAGVLSAGTQSDLNALLKSVDDQAKAQVFVVTVHTIDNDEPVEQFANELFAKWKPGGAKSDRGVLMVFSIQDRKRWIEIGYGLEGILPDAKTGDIGRDMVPDLQAANYNGAVRTGANEIADVIAKDANVTLATQPQHTYRRARNSSSGGGFGIFGFLFVLFILFLLFRGGGRGGRGGGGGGLLQGLILGNLLGGGRSWGSGSGWSDGGGSWGGGDGGGSWGGGDSGGGFSGGDGGSSGGGGAGGSW